MTNDQEKKVSYTDTDMTEIIELSVNNKKHINTFKVLNEKIDLIRKQMGNICREILKRSKWKFLN